MPADPPRPPRRRLRRWLISFAVVGIVGLAILAALVPSLVQTSFVRGKILARINAVVAPGRLDVDRFEVSWTGPTRLINLRLFAPGNARVAQTPLAELDRSLGGLILASKQPIVLDLGPADLQIQRHADGSLDLADALQGLIAHPDPTQSKTILIKGGTLTVRANGLAEPIAARLLDLDLKIPAAPRPLTWDLKLVHADGGELVARGDTNRWTAPGEDPSRADLRLDVMARRWPVGNQVEGIVAAGWLDGSIEVARRSERWSFDATTRLLDSSLTGKPLAGDTFRPGPLTLNCDIKQGATGWTVRRLILDSSVGSLRGEGPLGGASDQDGARRVEGRIDLAAIARQLPHALRLRPGLTVEGGEARLVAEMKGPLDHLTFTLDATLAKLAARDGDRRFGLHDPATLTAHVARLGDVVTIETLAARTSFGTASMTGRLDDATLTGSFDLGALRRQVAEWVDVGPVDASGRATLAGTYKVSDQRFAANLQIQAEKLHVAGLPSGSVNLDRATLTLTAQGRPVDPGWPATWESAEVIGQAGGAEARVEFQRAGDMVAVGGRLVAGLPGGEPDRRVETTLAGSWDDAHRVLNCDRFAARLVPTDRDHAGRLIFAASGRMDAAAGTVRFDPVPGGDAASALVRLNPEGLRISGLGRELATVQVDAGLTGDVLGRPDHWSASIQARGEPQGVRFSARGRLESASLQPLRSDPGSFVMAGQYQRADDRIELTDCRAGSAYGGFTLSGTLDDPTGGRRFDFRGQVAPDFAAITAWLQREVEPGAKLAGQSGKFHLGGAWSGTDPVRSVEGEFGLDLAGIDVYGIKLGATPVVLRARDGQILVDPISTTLNEGHIRLEPEVLVSDSQGDPVLRLGKNSSIRDARINDEVSRRVLAFVAPILEGTTRASGRVSVDIDHAEIPLRSGRSRRAQLDGAVVFNDVAFAPGPLANDLLGAVGRRDAVLRLDRPVTLTIADGRINQSGLALPLGDLTRVELAGWVDFDRNLNLTASLPVTPAMLGNNALLSDIAAGTQVRLPITGTLDRPTIDQEAFAASMKDLGKSLLTRGATRGAMELLLRLGQPRDPNAPPPLTSDQRKAARQERKAERKLEREAPPDR